MIRFEKMHGLGNDFAIVDERRAGASGIAWAGAAAGRVCDRRFGVGCDQMIVLRPSASADAFMHIYNADGGEAAACGNAARCVAWLLMRESGRDRARIETAAGLLECRAAGENRVRVDMGAPRLGWREIPLLRETETRQARPEALARLRERFAGLPEDGVAVGMGNPHFVCFVADPASLPLAEIGPALEHDALFPERANITLAAREAENRLRIRTWERGAGETPACGTAACASAVAARLLGLCAPEVAVAMDGGSLAIGWEGSASDPAHPVRMTGETAHVFSGTLSALSVVGGSPP